MYFVINRQRIYNKETMKFLHSYNKLKYIFFINKQNALRGYEKVSKRYSRRGRFGTYNEYLEKRYTALNSVCFPFLRNTINDRNKIKKRDVSRAFVSSKGSLTLISGQRPLWESAKEINFQMCFRFKRIFEYRLSGLTAYFYFKVKIYYDLFLIKIYFLHILLP